MAKILLTLTRWTPGISVNRASRWMATQTDTAMVTSGTRASSGARYTSSSTTTTRSDGGQRGVVQAVAAGPDQVAADAGRPGGEQRAARRARLSPASLQRDLPAWSTVACVCTAR